MTCRKRQYESVETARAAHSRAGFRIRIYDCEECGKMHVTNADKGWRWDDAVSGCEANIDGQLAPEMSLEELRAEADRRKASKA